jgi:hypothetical protein
MITSLKMSLSNELKSDLPLSERAKAYFRERIRNRLFNLISREYIRESNENGLTQARISRRLGKSPVQINRWLGAPGNWTLDTISDLLLAISASELVDEATKINVVERRNYKGPDWLFTEDSQVKSVSTQNRLETTIVVNADEIVTSWNINSTRKPISISENEIATNPTLEPAV